MLTGTKKVWLGVVLLIVIGGALPVLHYWYYTGQILVTVPVDSSIPFRESPRYEQLALVTAVLIVKPIYMLLSLVLILILWRVRSPDVLALRRGLFSFLVGETFCAFNIAFFNHSLYLFEFFHMYGMVVCFSFVTYAIIQISDLRVLGYSDPKQRCGLLGLCRQCTRSGDGACALTRIFYFLVPAGIVLAFIPLLSGTHAVSYNTTILGFPYNYSHPVVYQVFEIRYAPVYAVVLLTAAFLVLHFMKAGVTAFRVLFAGGIGALGFALLRLVFFNVNRDNLVWFNFWEEVTELMFVGGVGFILWTFRHGLLPGGVGRESD